MPCDAAADFLRGSRSSAFLLLAESLLLPIASCLHLVAAHCFTLSWEFGMAQPWCAPGFGVAFVVAFLAFNPRLCSAWYASLHVPCIGFWRAVAGFGIENLCLINCDV